MRKEVCEYVDCKLFKCSVVSGPCFGKYAKYKKCKTSCRHFLYCALQVKIETVKKTPIESLVPFLISEVGIVRLEAKKQFEVKERLKDVLS